MVFTEVFLNSLGIYDLRKIGTKIGVKSPTTLKKQQLIKEILCVQSGKKPPIKSVKGRKSNRINFSHIDTLTIEPLVDEFLLKLKQKILSLFK